MSDFKTLKGLYIKHVSSDPSDLIEGQIWYNTTTQRFKASPLISAWSSGGNYPISADGVRGAGLQTAAFGVGGDSSGGSTVLNTCAEYDGSSWTAGGNYVTTVLNAGTCGTQTAGLAFGGNPYSALTEEYNVSVTTRSVDTT